MIAKLSNPGFCSRTASSVEETQTKVFTREHHGPLVGRETRSCRTRWKGSNPNLCKRTLGAAGEAQTQDVSGAVRAVGGTQITLLRENSMSSWRDSSPSYCRRNPGQAQEQAKPKSKSKPLQNSTSRWWSLNSGLTKKSKAVANILNSLRATKLVQCFVKNFKTMNFCCRTLL